MNSGTIFAGGIAAGVYTTNSADACYQLANDCGAQILLVENEVHLDKFLSARDKLPNLKVSE